MAVLIGVVLAISMLCSRAIGNVGGRLIDEQRAQSLANAVALAAIHDPDTAELLAVVVGGELQSLDDRRTEDGTVKAVVRIGAATTDATAFDTWFGITPTLEP